MENFPKFSIKPKKFLARKLIQICSLIKSKEILIKPKAFKVPCKFPDSEFFAIQSIKAIINSTNFKINDFTPYIPPTIEELKSNNTIDKISIQVFDLNGRLVSFQTGNANQEYQIGEALQAGLYFVNVIQGNEIKQVKLIKH